MIRTVNAALPAEEVNPDKTLVLGVFEHILADLVPKGSDKGAFRHDAIDLSVLGEARIFPQR